LSDEPGMSGISCTATGFSFASLSSNISLLSVEYSLLTLAPAACSSSNHEFSGIRLTPFGPNSKESLSFNLNQ